MNSLGTLVSTQMTRMSKMARASENLYFVEISITSKTGETLAQSSVQIIFESYADYGFTKFDNSSIKISPASAKFSCKISNWPFKSRSDKLFLGISTLASGNGGVYSEGKRLIVGDGFIDEQMKTAFQSTCFSKRIQQIKLCFYSNFHYFTEICITIPLLLYLL
jgi:hypothetical protein